MRFRLGLGVYLLAAAVLFGAPVARAVPCPDAHIALVIGNKTYPDNDVILSEPAGNAKRIAQTLQQLGFETQVEEDLTKAKMQKAFDQLENKVTKRSIVFVFFSGFGLRSGNHTYLIPTDASIWSEEDVKTNGLSLDRLVSDIEAKGAKAQILVIDAARRNPFERRFRLRGSTGLAAVSGANNLIALYSTAPDTVFDPSDAEVSAFADDLAKAMETSGATVEDAFRHTRNDVMRLSRAGMQPWISSSLSADLPLDARDCQAPAAANAKAAPAEQSKEQTKPQAPAPAPQPVPAPQKDAAIPPPEKTTAPQTSSGSEQKPAVTARAPAASTPAVPPAAAAKPAPARPETAVNEYEVTLDDPGLIEETRQRLYEQNLDPGPAGSDSMADAIRKFEKQAGLPSVGRATKGLLHSLREAESLKPWGAIIVASDATNWGMSWGSPTRQQALAVAKARCGSSKCDRELSFFGHRCGAFALSPQNWWSAVWKNSGETSRQAALNECGKHGQTCRIIGAVCADGSEKTN